MPPVDDALIRELANFSGELAPVVSLYLDVDGKRFPRARDVDQQFEALARRARELAADGDLSREAKASVEADLQRIADHVRNGIDRSRTRGVAVFACGAHDFWRVVELAVPPTNRVAVQPSPQLRELESVRDHGCRTAVVLADRQRARLFVFHQGELMEKTELDEPLPRHDDEGDLSRDQVADHTAAAAHRHLRRVAREAFVLFRDQGFDALVLGAPEEVVGLLERELHQYLRDRIAARITVAVGASDDEIRRAAVEVEAEVERAREAVLVRRLRDALGTGSGGVAGLEPTLAAVVARRAAVLLVSEGYEAPGWRCPSCSFVGVRGRQCPVCSTEMRRLDDVVEAAVELAVGQSCQVVPCVNADLDVLGRIGALLRY